MQVMVYNGALDIICGLPLAEAMLQSLEWAGSAEYFAAPKIQWKVNAADKEVAGYVRLARNLYQVFICLMNITPAPQYSVFTMIE